VKNLFKLLTLVIACAFIYVVYLNALTGRYVEANSEIMVIDTWNGTLYWNDGKGIIKDGHLQEVPKKLKNN